MKYRLTACAALLAFALLFSGCSARTPISADTFQKQAKAAGFTLPDSASSAPETELTATDAKTGTELTFFSFAAESTASEQYVSLKSSLSAPGASVASTLDSTTYNKCRITVGELSYTLVRMDKTIVSAKTTAAHQDQVDRFLKAIRY